MDRPTRHSHCFIEDRLDTAWATAVEGTTTLQQARIAAVLGTLLRSRASSVLDLGCGRGELLVHIARAPQFRRIVAIDVSGVALDAARQALQHLGLPAGSDRLQLLEASFCEPNPQLEGFDACVLLETLEHIDAHRLSTVEHAVFANYRPRLVVVTTPNSEYNVLFGMPDGVFRHEDHRFEWNRVKFEAWCRGVARRNRYNVDFHGIGHPHPVLGSATQMATFFQTNGRCQVGEEC